MKRDAKKQKKLAQAANGRARYEGKAPRTASDSDRPAKTPRTLGIEHEDAFQRRPVWRFANLDPKHPEGAVALDASGFREFHEALGNYETQTCAEIWGQHDNGCKRYEVESTHENIIKRLLELDRDDETAVHTLRVKGAYRVYGILRENVFHVLWLDPDHEMYPSRLRNT